MPIEIRIDPRAPRQAEIEHRVTTQLATRAEHWEVTLEVPLSSHYCLLTARSGRFARTQLLASHDTDAPTVGRHLTVWLQQFDTQANGVRKQPFPDPAHRPGGSAPIKR